MGKILIVDDSRFSRIMLRRLLEALNHQVIEAPDGFVALEYYQTEQPDIVFLDMTMEVMHGLDVLDRLVELDPNVSVIVGTADTQESTQQEVFLRGAKAFVSKPFDQQKLTTALMQVLSNGETQ